MDGQQFDRVQTLDGNEKPPTPFRVRPIRAFGTNNVVLACKDGGPCKVGDTDSEGFTVFYVAPDRLIANGIAWQYLSFYVDSELEFQFSRWCTVKKTMPTRRGLGEGIRNTRLIDSLCGYRSIDEYFIHSPSIDELRLALQFLGNPTGSYWSSTSSGATKAFAMVCDGKTCTEVVKDRDEVLNWIFFRTFK